MGNLPEFVGNHPVLVGGFILVLAAIVFTEWRRFTQHGTGVSPFGATRLINHEDAVLVDVREESEWRRGHIVNARHIPMGSLEGRLKELNKHKNRPIVLYCQTGDRSGRALKTLTNNGFDQVYNLSGGITAWQNESLPVTKKD